MKMLQSFAKLRRMFVPEQLLILGLVLALPGVAPVQQGKGTPDKVSVTGRYEGTAKNNAGEVITVALDLTEKEGVLSGMIRSSHGDFTITGGSHQGETVTLEFDAGGPAGSISLHVNDDRLVGTWSAGEDGGPVEVRKVPPQEDTPKGKP
jgi:hypothetical protein